MSPEEICRKLGEKKIKGMFQELTADGMKKVLKEARIPTTRLVSHTSTRKRNEDWCNRLWQKIADRSLAEASSGAAALLFEWLTRTRRPMLAQLLDGLEVEHEGGLTDADFMQAAPPEKLCEV